jgi:hypothetical protein
MAKQKKRELVHVEVPVEGRRPLVERGTHAVIDGKFVDVSDWSVEDKLAHAKRPTAEKCLDGELKLIVCAGIFHDAFRAKPPADLAHLRSWDEMGTYTGDVPTHGEPMCDRCAEHRARMRREESERKRAALRAAFGVDDAALDLLLAAVRS